MRFLCLHGKGTSAKIFKSQTASFRSRLPSTYTFDFIDGPFPTTPAAGVDLFYQPPYYSFYATPSVASIRASHQWLLDLCARSGPYDGVLCFSQGCALIASFLLCHASETPHSPLPFKCAVFICGGIPLNVLEDLGCTVTDEARMWDDRSKTELFAKGGVDSIVQHGADHWARGSEDLEFDPSALIDRRNVFGLDFGSFEQSLRIAIPTVHVYGSKDPRFPASMQLAEFCEGGVRRVFDHGGGHDVPRTRDVSEAIAGLVEWVDFMGERVAAG